MTSPQLSRESDLSDPQVRDFLVSAAVAAPSVHNSQPWRFHVEPHSIDVVADQSRRLAVIDESGRYLAISCGAALFNLRVAGTYLGFHPRVSVLPSPHDRTHIAHVDLSHRHMRPGSLAKLYPSIAARRTNRFPFTSQRIPGSVLAAISEAVWLENAVLRLYDDQAEVDRIVDLLRDAEFEESLQPAVARERDFWVGREEPGEGVPTESLGPRPAQPRTVFRDLSARADSRPRADFETAPVVGVLSTIGDGPADWVRAGQALQRALLVATAHGLSASFVNQPLEYPGLRWLARSPITGHGHTQMLIRLGYGPPVPSSPRRPIADVLI